MKRTSDVLVDEKGRRYCMARIKFSEVKVSPYAYKEYHQEMVNKLKADLRERWILQPVTCYEQDGELFLADGKHRYRACQQHDEELEKVTKMEDKWMNKDVDAKVYLDLPDEEIPGLVMALDDVRKKGTASEKQVGLSMSYIMAEHALSSSNPSVVPDEASILNRIQYIQVRKTTRGGKRVIPKAASREVIVANHIGRLVEDSPVLGSMVTGAQVPRRLIEIEARRGQYRLLTRENLASCIRHIVRPIPVSAPEMEGGMNPREIEYNNLLTALEHLANLVIIPLAKEDIAQGVAICRRHAIEAVGRTMWSIFIQEYKLDADEPLFGEEIEDWEPFDDYITRMLDINWADPTFQSQRSAEAMYGGSHQPVDPEVVRIGIKGYVFPKAP